jgi:hypothetical protein
LRQLFILNANTEKIFLVGHRVLSINMSVNDLSGLPLKSSMQKIFSKWVKSCQERAIEPNNSMAVDCACQGRCCGGSSGGNTVRLCSTAAQLGQIQNVAVCSYNIFPTRGFVLY